MNHKSSLVGVSTLLMCILALTFVSPAAAVDKHPMPPRHILIVLTSHSMIPDSGKTTGFWFDELATPYYLFKDAGYEVSLYSINGGRPPIDPRSEQEKTAAVERFLKDNEAMAQLAHTRPISDAKAEMYDAIFLCGGHGALWDFVGTSALTTLLQQFVDDNKIIAAIDHAPVALYGLKRKDGAKFIKERNVTGFTKAEEEELGLFGILPTYPDLMLQSGHAHVIRAKPFKPQAVRDGNLITGQNPASSAKLARLVLDAMGDLNRKPF